MIIDEIRDFLFAKEDKTYALFSRKLIPTIDSQSMIGVRIPALRALAKELNKREDLDVFLSDLPHRYFEENQLHSLLLSQMKDFEVLSDALEDFLPYVDNWATCDLLSPRITATQLPRFLTKIETWLTSDHEYTVRFGVGMLMQHFLGDAFDLRYPNMVANLRSDAYYVNMMIAWFFATALVKRYEATLPFLEQGKLSSWTQNKAIQKAIESRRISAEQKAYLKTLRRQAK